MSVNYKIGHLSGQAQAIIRKNDENDKRLREESEKKKNIERLGKNKDKE